MMLFEHAALDQVPLRHFFIVSASRRQKQDGISRSNVAVTGSLYDDRAAATIGPESLRRSSDPFYIVMPHSLITGKLCPEQIAE